MSATETVREPGVYRDMPENVYHADPCPEPSLSSTIAKLMLTRSPWHAMMKHPRLNPDFERERREAFDLGRVAHELLLGRGGGFEVIDAEDWRSKATREARDAARKAGRAPILRPQYEMAGRMVDALRDQLAGHEAAGAFEGGWAETTLIWREDIGIWCRARLDWMPEPRDGMAIYDYKTTSASAHPVDFGNRTMFSLGYHIQAAFYLLAVERVLGTRFANIRFVVQETSEPFAAAVYDLDIDALELGRGAVRRAITTFERCLRTGVWPGYPRRVVTVSAPAWAQMREEEASALDAAAVRAAVGAQAPEGSEW